MLQEGVERADFEVRDGEGVDGAVGGAVGGGLDGVEGVVAVAGGRDAVREGEEQVL